MSVVTPRGIKNIADARDYPAVLDSNYVRLDGTVTGATSQAQVFTNGIDSGTSFTLNSIDYTESFETGFSVINLLPDSGRFAGTSNPNKRLAATFVTPEWIEPYNSSTAWTSAGEFIHNNTTFGGSAGALTQDVQDLLVAMGRTSGSTNRYGNEFFIAESTMGSGTAAAKSGKYLLAITSNELDSVFGLANKLSYSYWVRAKSGASIIVSSRTTLADSFYVDGVDSSGVDVTLTEENNSDGWHHIAVQGYYRAFGYDNSMPYIYANDGTVVQMALPIFALGSVLIPQHVAPIPTINHTLWGDGTDYYLRDSSYSVGANIRTDTIRPDSDATDAIIVQNAAGSSDVLTVDTTNGGMKVLNFLGVNAAATATAYKVRIGGDSGDTRLLRLDGFCDGYALEIVPTMETSGSATMAIRMFPKFDVTADTSSVYVINNSSQIDGDFDITTIHQNFFQLQLLAGHTGTVTWGYGMHFPAISNAGSGSITNWYGVHVADQTVPTGAIRAFSSALNSGTSHHNLYMTGTADNYLAGKLGIGDSTPSWDLQVAGDTQLGGASDNNGFFGATPAAQPAHIVDADGTLADITTKFNTLLAQMATLGLQAAS